MPPSGITNLLFFLFFSQYFIFLTFFYISPSSRHFLILFICSVNKVSHLTCKRCDNELIFLPLTASVFFNFLEKTPPHKKTSSNFWFIEKFCSNGRMKKMWMSAKWLWRKKHQIVQQEKKMNFNHMFREKKSTNLHQMLTIKNANFSQMVIRGKH